MSVGFIALYVKNRFPKREKEMLDKKLCDYILKTNPEDGYNLQQLFEDRCKVYFQGESAHLVFFKNNEIDEIHSGYMVNELSFKHQYGFAFYKDEKPCYLILHNENGPAQQSRDGTKFFLIKGAELTKEESDII